MDEGKTTFSVVEVGVLAAAMQLYLREYGDDDASPTTRQVAEKISKLYIDHIHRSNDSVVLIEVEVKR
jgi:hypothetical protein